MTDRKYVKEIHHHLNKDELLPTRFLLGCRSGGTFSFIRFLRGNMISNQVEGNDSFFYAKIFLKTNRKATGRNTHKLMDSNILFLIG